jgi:ligand-binding sensor domain-containing protein
MNRFTTMLLFALCLALAPSASAGTYPQLIANQYSDPSRLPPDFKRPAFAYDFVATANLPAQAKVLSAASAANGVVWVVTDRGVFRSDKNGYVPLEDKPRRLKPRQPSVGDGLKVSAVSSDKQGHIWAATNLGLLATDGADWWQMLNGRDGVPYEVMTCLHLAVNGDVWGGTPEGAWRLRDGQFRYFWGRRWLPGNRVRQIWTDNRGPLARHRRRRGLY